MRDFYRRNLPHWQPEGAICFITFRLANSLPLQIMQQLQEERQRERAAIHAKFRGAEQRNQLYTLDKKFTTVHLVYQRP